MATRKPADGPPGDSPLTWLSQRRDRSGAALITSEQKAAGDRLAADYLFAEMMPRVTSSWSGMPGERGRARGGQHGGGEMRDQAIAARQRVRRALDAVGPELSSLLIDVCCHERGLEVLERNAGWPARSGKVVLQLALTRLARHYGLLPPVAETSAADGRRAVQHWGRDGYRPSLGCAPESKI